MMTGEVQAIIAEADLNGDGKLDYAEFCQFLSNTSEECIQANHHKVSQQKKQLPMNNKLPESQRIDLDQYKAHFPESSASSKESVESVRQEGVDVQLHAELPLSYREHKPRVGLPAWTAPKSSDMQVPGSPPHSTGNGSKNGVRVIGIGGVAIRENVSHAPSEAASSTPVENTAANEDRQTDHLHKGMQAIEDGKDRGPSSDVGREVMAGVPPASDVGKEPASDEGKEDMGQGTPASDGGREEPAQEASASDESKEQGTLGMEREQDGCSAGEMDGDGDKDTQEKLAGNKANQAESERGVSCGDKVPVQEVSPSSVVTAPPRKPKNIEVCKYVRMHSSKEGGNSRSYVL